MTKVQLLNSLCGFCKKAVKGMKLPVKPQKSDETAPKPRAPDIYAMRLTDSNSYKELSPYIIVQMLNSKHFRDEENYNQSEYYADVRLVFSVYCEDEQEGAIMLLNVMERVEQEILKSVKIGDQFLLDENKGLEDVFYHTDSAPFYGGELLGTFKLIPIEREVDYFGKS